MLEPSLTVGLLPRFAGGPLRGLHPRAAQAFKWNRANATPGGHGVPPLQASEQPTSQTA